MANAEGPTVYALLHNGFYHISRFLRRGSPSSLGVAAADEIPTDTDSFMEWVKHLRRCCENVESEDYRQFIEDMNDGKTGTTWLPLSEDVEYSYFLSRTPPRVGRSQSWIYTIDLDRLLFTVDNTAHFDLYRIPRGEGSSGNWVQYLALDGRGCRCLKPGTPAIFTPNYDDLSYTTDSISKGLTKAVGYFKTQAMSVDTFKDAAFVLPYQECAAQIAKGYITSFFEAFHDARSHHPSTAHFQEKAAFLLSLLAPGFYNSASSELSNDGDGSVFALSTSPRGSLFHFRGCLVVMTNHLEQENRVQAHIGDVVEYVLSSGLDECTAILCSVQHVAVLKLVDQGRTVEYSPVLPLLAAFRVEADDTRLMCTLRLLACHLSPAVVQNDANIVPDPCDKEVLSLDIIIQIMGYVEKETYCAMANTCKALRFQCIAHPLVGPYHLLGFSSAERHLRASIKNGPAVNISFDYQMHSDKMQEVEPGWYTVTTDFPSCPSSLFSFKRSYGKDILDFFVGPVA